MKIKFIVYKKFLENINNETIGQSCEAVICNIYNITCHINKDRRSSIIERRITKQILDQNILKELPCKVKSSVGYKNGSIDFILENNQTLSLKTLKYKKGKICPQKVGQPTLKSWDKIWKQNTFLGELDKNPLRWKFIKDNIHHYLNIMLNNTFCCDYLLIITNCLESPNCKLFHKLDFKYFNNQNIIYSRHEYEERWNSKKNKTSEFSSTIKMKINEELITIGEFQFHKSSRKELKFRFYETFLQKLF